MPKMKLTKRVVEIAQPGPSDYELRDTEVPGFLCKVTPSGRKVFMVQYRNISGRRRKPAIGQFGQLTVDQARAVAQRWISEAAGGLDPSIERQKRRGSPTVLQFAEMFFRRHVEVNNKKSTQKGREYRFKRVILPTFGQCKIDEFSRQDIVLFMDAWRGKPGLANSMLNDMQSMFTCAEQWGYCEEGSNPCKGVKRNGQSKTTRLITTKEMKRVIEYLDKSELENLLYPDCIMAIRLQLAFAARASEIIALEWDWINFESKCVIWPDSKTGAMWKPFSSDVAGLLLKIPRKEGSQFVFPGRRSVNKHLNFATYHRVWRRILKECDVPGVGTHGLRHRAATDIANSGLPLKVGMALTGHRRLATFMRYVHVEDDQVRRAVNVMAEQRLNAYHGEE